MPITPTKSPDIFPGWVNASNAVKKTAKDLIDDTRFDYTSLWYQGGRTIVQADGVRIDHQGSYMTESIRHHNLQVQTGHNTISHVDVSESLQTQDPINQRGVMNHIRYYLKASLYDGHSYFISGSIP